MYRFINTKRKLCVCVCVTYTHICSLGGQRTSRIFLYCFLPALLPWVRVSTGPETYGLCQWALRIFLSLISNVGVPGTHGSAKLFMTEFRSSCPLSHLPSPTGFLSCRYFDIRNHSSTFTRIYFSVLTQVCGLRQGIITQTDSFSADLPFSRRGKRAPCFPKANCYPLKT